MIQCLNTRVTFETGGLFSWDKKELHAVHNVSLQWSKATTLGLVGESGSGKTTLGRAILGLQPIQQGKILLDGVEISKLSRKQRLPYNRRIQAIFQDPFSSLNPRLSIEEIVSEGLVVHEPTLNRKERKDRVVEILNKVNLSSEMLSRYPHEFSGGQRQRISIARALILNPQYVICDEAVSALDVSTQAQVLNLLLELKQEKQLSYLFISHDLGVVQYIADEIAVMYLGEIVEWGTKKEILHNPQHPYTRALFSSSFDLKNRKKERIVLKGEIPSILNRPQGCVFQSRCPKVTDICRMTIPPEVEVTSTQTVKCHLVDSANPKDV